MERALISRIAAEISQNNRAALMLVTGVSGSSPGAVGTMMGYFEDGTTLGTIGGGLLEAEAIRRADEALSQGTDCFFEFELNGNDGMICGGQAVIFIKTFVPPVRLLIIGGGHISLELYRLARILGFQTVIFEDRFEYANRDRFPEADEIVLGDIKESLENYQIDNQCYVVIISRGHSNDEIALQSVIKTKAAYIGMIGSHNKTKQIMNNINKTGVTQIDIDKVYAPIGLALGGNSPAEIAFSIMAEILKVKNQGSLSHLKNLSATQEELSDQN